MPNTDPVVRPLRRAQGATGDAGMPAHITLLYPFLEGADIDEGVRAALREMFAPYRSFDVAFQRPARADGMLYLPPEPADAFVALHQQIRNTWPRLLPYEGRYGAGYTPHLSIAYGDEGRLDPDGVFGPLEAALEAHLPLRSQARSVWLVVRRDGHWLHQGTFPLQGDAPVYQPGGADAAGSRA
jgi:hypothetical protein